MSTMIGYEPWNAARALSDEMNRALGLGSEAGGSTTGAVTGRWRPAVDIKEEESRFVIVADVPGVDPADIEVTFDNGVLTIKGERTLENVDEGGAGYLRTERRHGTVYRQFSLPDTADAQAISATGSNGVLEVVVPKKQAVLPKRIKVAA